MSSPPLLIRFSLIRGIHAMFVQPSLNFKHGSIPVVLVLVVVVVVVIDLSHSWFLLLRSQQELASPKADISSRDWPADCCKIIEIGSKRLLCELDEQYEHAGRNSVGRVTARPGISASL